MVQLKLSHAIFNFSWEKEKKTNNEPKIYVSKAFSQFRYMIFPALKQFVQSSAVTVCVRIKVKDEFVSSEASIIEVHSIMHSSQ